MHELKKVYGIRLKGNEGEQIMEPKRYYFEDTRIVSEDNVTCAYFRADDPIIVSALLVKDYIEESELGTEDGMMERIVDAFRKATLYDLGNDTLRAKLEKQYRTAIEGLKAQCIAYGEREK
jgi:hypothetical protein